MTSHRMTMIAATGALALVLSACGGDDEPETTTAPTVEAPAATTEAPAEETTEEETTEAPAEETTEEETTEAEANADGVPALEDIYETAMANAKGAESVHATLEGESDGQDASMNLQGQLDDSNYHVLVSMGQGTVEIIGADGETYLNGSEEFWTESAGVPEPGNFVDRWVIIPAEMGLDEQFGMSGMWDLFLSDMPQTAVGMGEVTGELVDLEGRETYHYVLEGEDVEIWIDAESEQFVQVIALEGTPDETVMKATDWDEAEPVEAPEDATPLEEIQAGG